MRNRFLISVLESNKVISLGNSFPSCCLFSSWLILWGHEVLMLPYYFVAVGQPSVKITDIGK